MMIQTKTVKTVVRMAALLLMLLLLPIAPCAIAEEEATEEDATALAGEEATAEDLTERCKLTADFSSSLSRLADDDRESAQRIAPGKSVTIAWDEDAAVKTVYVSFYFDPLPYTVLQHDESGALLSEAPGELLWNNAIAVADGASSVTIRAGDEEIALCSLYAYGEGVVPNVHPWQPTPEKLDYLVVSMHPDDDVLFLGGIVPVYGAEQGREGSILYMATRMRTRVDEAMNGAWTMGLRNQPLFGGFPDIPNDYREQYKNTFKSADVEKYLVRQYRKYRPEIVVSQDPKGEYGHWQHVLLSRSVIKAALSAADPAYDAKSFEEYGAWEVKKVYLHLNEENKIVLPVTEPLMAFGGKTAVQVAAEAFLCHESQLPSRHSVSNEGVYSLFDFGLAYTTVGADTPGVNDMFEHIDPAVLRTRVETPEPTPEPMPESTPEPPIEPAAVPTAEPAAVPTAEPVAAPLPMETPMQTPIPEPMPPDVDHTGLMLLAGAVLLVLVSLLLVLLFGKRRRARRRKRRCARRISR